MGWTCAQVMRVAAGGPGSGCRHGVWLETEPDTTPRKSAAEPGLGTMKKGGPERAP